MTDPAAVCPPDTDAHCVSAPSPERFKVTAAVQEMLLNLTQSLQRQVDPSRVMESSRNYAKEAEQDMANLRRLLPEAIGVDQIHTLRSNGVFFGHTEDGPNIQDPLEGKDYRCGAEKGVAVRVDRRLGIALLSQGGDTPKLFGIAKIDGAWSPVVCLCRRLLPPPSAGSPTVSKTASR